MNKKLRDPKAQSVLEYAVLLMILMGALILMNKYIVQGFSGKWKGAGDSFGFGRQFDPDQTLECAYSMVCNRWYDVKCYKACKEGTEQSATNYYAYLYIQCREGRGECSGQDCQKCAESLSKEFAEKVCVNGCDGRPGPTFGNNAPDPCTEGGTDIINKCNVLTKYDPPELAS